MSQWGFQGSVRKAYDKSCKGFVLILDHAAKGTIPQDTRNDELYLVQPYIILQIMVTDKKFFNVEIAITDNFKTKRRLIFNSGQNYSLKKDNIIKQPLHTRIPCDLIIEGVWLNLQLDIPSFNENCFGQNNYRSIDSITVSGSCRLRKIFTSKYQMPDSTSLWLESQFGEEIASDFDQQFHQDSQYQIEDIPKSFNFGIGIDFLNQVLSFDRIIYWGYIKDQLHNAGNVIDQKKILRPEIVFGTRVTSKPVLESRQQIQTALTQIDKAKKQYSPSQILKGGINEGVIYNSENTQQNGQRRFDNDGRKQSQQRSLDPSKSQFTNNGSPQSNISMKYYKRNLSDNSIQSPTKSVLPLSITENRLQTMEDQQSESNFGQYNEATPLNFQQSKEYNLPNIKQQRFTQLSTSSKITRINSRITNARNQQPMDDDQLINQKLQELELARQQINQMAYRYNLENNVKIDQFSLLTIRNASHLGHHHMGEQNPENILFCTEQKDRVWEYHEKVHQRRQRIHKKQLAKKKLEKVNADAQVQVLQQSNIDGTRNLKKEGDEQDEVESSERSKTKQEGINEKDKIDGWDGDENELAEDDYGNENNEANEEDNGDGSAAKNEEGDDGGGSENEDLGDDEDGEAAAEEGEEGEGEGDGDGEEGDEDEY